MKNEELKKLMEARRKQRNEDQRLPPNAKLIEGMWKCTDCFQVCAGSLDFQKHLTQDKHKKGLLTLNRRQDLETLEREASKEDKTKKSKLTKEMVERINQEVDAEFAEKIQQEVAGQAPCELPEDFFDKIEVEAQMQKRFEQEQKQKAQEDSAEVEDPQEAALDIQKLRTLHRKKQQTKQSSKLYDFIDQSLKDPSTPADFSLQWKQKS